MSRQGKHREGKVSVGIYVDEDKRALIAYLVDQTGMTATDIIMEGVMSKARAVGLFDTRGKLKPEHAAAIEVIVESYRMKKGKQ